MWTDFFWDEWGAFYSMFQKTHNQVKAAIEERCNTDRLPLAVVAFEDTRVVGIGCLKQQDLEKRSQWSPWLAGVFVMPEYRRRAVGSQIVKRLEKEARRLNFSKLYLWTPSSEVMYSSLGWHVVEKMQHSGVLVTVMAKVIVQRQGLDSM